MKGVNHIITNTASLIIAGGILDVLLRGNTNLVSQIDRGVAYISDSQGLFVWLYIFLSIVAYYFGTLLPDIDSKNSLLGRYIYLPIEHRTWTHTIWPVALFMVISIKVRIFFWLGFGYYLHLFWDNFSRQGVCFFYPLGKGYWVAPDGNAKVKIGHKFKLYSVGSKAESIIVSIIVFVASVMVVIMTEGGI